jgi:hypothetical protein
VPGSLDSEERRVNRGSTLKATLRLLAFKNGEKMVKDFKMRVSLKFVRRVNLKGHTMAEVGSFSGLEMMAWSSVLAVEVEKIEGVIHLEVKLTKISCGLAVEYEGEVSWLELS